MLNEVGLEILCESIDTPKARASKARGFDGQGGVNAFYCDTKSSFWILLLAFSVSLSITHG